MKLFKVARGATKPEKQTKGSVGYDLVASSVGKLEGKHIIYDTGISIDTLPENTHFKLYARSSIYKTHLTLANGVGVIDSDYKDTIKVIFSYDSSDGFLDMVLYKAGDRIAQLVLEPTIVVKEEKPSLKERTGGFGSTDIKLSKKSKKGRKFKV